MSHSPSAYEAEFDEEMDSLIDRVRSLREDVAAFYGDDYDPVIAADHALDDFSPMVHYLEGNEWWSIRRRELLVAKSSLDRCVFTTAKLDKLNQRLLEVLARAEDKNFPARAPVQDRIKWASLIMHDMATRSAKKFPQAKVRDPANAIRMKDIADAIGVLSKLSLGSQQKTIVEKVDHWCNILRVRVNLLFDVLFGKGAGVGVVLMSERLSHPLGRIILGTALENIEYAAEQYNKQVHNWLPGEDDVHELLIASCAYLHVVLDGVEQDLVLTDLSDKEKVDTEQLGRVIFGLSVDVSRHHTEKFIKQVKELHGYTDMLVDLLFGFKSAWVKRQFEQHLSEIRTRSPLEAHENLSDKEQ